MNIRNVYISAVLLLANLSILAMQDAPENPQSSEEIKWTDASDYARYLKDVDATPQNMQDYIKRAYNISDEKVEQMRGTYYAGKPIQQLFGSIHVTQYLRKNVLGIWPWKFVVDAHDPLHDMCDETYRLLQKSLRKEISPKAISALMQNAHLCQENAKKEIQKLKQKNPKGIRDCVIAVIGTDLQRKQEIVEKVQYKFDTKKTQSTSPYDLPHSVRAHYEHYTDNKKTRQTLRESSVREVCNHVNASMQEAFYKLRLAKAHHINGELDKSENTIHWVTDLLGAVRTCEEIRNSEKK